MNYPNFYYLQLKIIIKKYQKKIIDTINVYYNNTNDYGKTALQYAIKNKMHYVVDRILKLKDKTHINNIKIDKINKISLSIVNSKNHYNLNLNYILQKNEIYKKEIIDNVTKHAKNNNNKTLLKVLRLANTSKNIKK